MKHRQSSVRQKAVQKRKPNEPPVSHTEFDRKRFKTHHKWWQALTFQEGFPPDSDVFMTPKPKADLKKNKIVCVDLFAGAGGMSLGIDSVKGMHVAVAVDLDKWCQLTYMANLGRDSKSPVAYIRRDIRKLKGSDIIDALVAMGYEPFVDYMHMSPPCQLYSSANTKTRMNVVPSLDSPENYCMKECIRLIKEIRPRAISFENVPGLVRTKMKAIFDEWVLRVKEAGYHFKWDLLNAADYGVPQNRVRVIGIGLEYGQVIEYDPWNVEAYELDQFAKRAHLGWVNEALNVYPAYYQENIAEGLDKFRAYEEVVLQHDPIPLNWQPDACDDDSGAQLLRKLSRPPTLRHLRCPKCGWEDNWDTAVQPFPYDQRLHCHSCLYEDDSLAFLSAPTAVDIKLGTA